MQHLKTIPEVRPGSVNAVATAVSDEIHVKNGRQFASWLGLLPRQHFIGDKCSLEYQKWPRAVFLVNDISAP